MNIEFFKNQMTTELEFWTEFKHYYQNFGGQPKLATSQMTMEFLLFNKNSSLKWEIKWPQNSYVNFKDFGQNSAGQP